MFVCLQIPLQSAPHYIGNNLPKICYFADSSNLPSEGLKSTFVMLLKFSTVRKNLVLIGELMNNDFMVFFNVGYLKVTTMV